MRQKRPFDSWDLLKLFGLVLMAFDHAGIFFFPQMLWLRAAGRSAMPVFLFLAGYAPSVRFKWNIFALALLLTASDLALTHMLRPLNILFLILIARAIFHGFYAREKTIARPWEWFIGCIILIASMRFVQFGSIGLLFALCGYLKRNREHYTDTTVRAFFIVSFAAYGLINALFGGFSPMENALMLIALAATCAVLWRFEVKPLALPKTLQFPALSLSRYSGYWYALHLIALEWLTKIPF